jgi:hypothetical protein
MSQKTIMDEMPNLPPRYYQKPNSLPRFLLSLVTLFIMLGALPIGVYLVSQRTQVLPEAALAQQERVGEVSLTLEQDKQSFSSSKQFPSTTSAQIAINLIAHSDNQAANLFASRINYPSQDLELVKVATSEAELQGPNQQPMVGKWIQEKVDNEAGQFDLIAGLPNPGIKTSPDEQYVMAKLIFKVKGGTEATLHLDPDSTIFTNDANQTLQVRKNDLSLALPVVTLASSSPSPKPKVISFKAPTSSLTLLSPSGGETIGFNSNSQISWQQSGLNQVMVNLLVNGEKLGQIASVSASLNQVSWKPASYLLPNLVLPTNTYQIELEGIDTAGNQYSATSAGPFAIVSGEANLAASQSVSLAARGGDANNDGQVDLTDLSMLLSSYGKKDNLNLGVDLNGDGVVNDVDLFLFKQVLLR